MDNNEITIKYEDIIQLEDYSITDPETIRQIALFGIVSYGKGLNLNHKVKEGYEVYGLYPHLQNFTKEWIKENQGQVDGYIKICADLREKRVKYKKTEIWEKDL